jgi:hypothetical protein
MNTYVYDEFYDIKSHFTIDWFNNPFNPNTICYENITASSIMAYINSDIYDIMKFRIFLETAQAHGVCIKTFIKAFNCCNMQHTSISALSHIERNDNNRLDKVIILLNEVSNGTLYVELNGQIIQIK